MELAGAARAHDAGAARAHDVGSHTSSRQDPAASPRIVTTGRHHVDMVTAMLLKKVMIASIAFPTVAPAAAGSGSTKAESTTRTISTHSHRGIDQASSRSRQTTSRDARLMIIECSWFVDHAARWAGEGGGGTSLTVSAVT